MQNIECTIMNHSVEFKLLPSGYISVGIDGWLVGNYANDAAAGIAALEQIRVADGLLDRPLLPGRVRAGLRRMAAAQNGLEQLSAADVFGLREIGRAEHGGQTWVVFDDGQYRHVVEAEHFDACGYMRRENDESRSEDYTDWCRGGLWAQDDVAAEVAAICGLTHVHSAQSGTCGRVDAVEADA